jgi:hydrogenase nickel incorporation protein HypA/HybF
MHELSIAEEMLKVALDHAAQAHAARIAQLNIEMSAWADESEESLHFYFERLTRGTIAQEARVQIQRVPARGICADCGNTFESESACAECPACHSFRVRGIRGNALRLISIEVN